MSGSAPGAGQPDEEPRRDDAVVRVLVICNKKGLHARASAKFVQTVEKFDADVRVIIDAQPTKSRILFVQKIGHAQGGRALHLVGIGRADAALGGADVGGGAGRFAGGVLGLVIRHHDVGFVADAPIRRRDLAAFGDEAIDLGEEGFGVDDDAVADDVENVRAEDADG